MLAEVDRKFYQDYFSSAISLDLIRVYLVKGGAINSFIITEANMALIIIYPKLVSEKAICCLVKRANTRVTPALGNKPNPK